MVSTLATSPLNKSNMTSVTIHHKTSTFFSFYRHALLPSSSRMSFHVHRLPDKPRPHAPSLHPPPGIFAWIFIAEVPHSHCSSMLIEIEPTKAHANGKTISTFRNRKFYIVSVAAVSRGERRTLLPRTQRRFVQSLTRLECQPDLGKSLDPWTNIARSCNLRAQALCEQPTAAGRYRRRY